MLNKHEMQTNMECVAKSSSVRNAMEYYLYYVVLYRCAWGSHASYVNWTHE